jgi:hypothetical protein
MATNPYINLSSFQAEQKLLEDVTVEIIQTVGQDCIYVPRNYFNIDRLFGEDPATSFDQIYTIEMYIMSYKGFEGTDVITQFGIEIKDKINLLMARKRFKEQVTDINSSITRPREGDLIYFPLSKSLFEINFVEHENPLYPFGKLYSYMITAELFTYSYEKVKTNNTTIDSIVSQTRGFSGSQIIPLNINIGTTAGINDTLQTEAKGYTFDPQNPFAAEESP